MKFSKWKKNKVNNIIKEVKIYLKSLRKKDNKINKKKNIEENIRIEFKLKYKKIKNIYKNEKKSKFFELKILDILSSIKIRITVNEYKNKSKFKK